MFVNVRCSIVLPPKKCRFNDVCGANPGASAASSRAARYRDAASLGLATTTLVMRATEVATVAMRTSLPNHGCAAAS